MITLADRKDCCGCAACAAACGHGAIRMVPDGMGFRYPVVDPEKCVDCHRCEDVCAFSVRVGVQKLAGHPQKGPKMQVAVQKIADHPQSEVDRAWAIRFPELMDRSQSGGLAFALMRKAVREGYVVYGAAMDADFVVRHRRVTAEAELEPLRLSKYVQSDMDGIGGQVLQDLRAGRKVLFTGTPCQCAGVGNLCASHRDKLLLADILCHGVPSPAIWRDYLRLQEEKSGKKLTGALFRDPSLGWHIHKETLLFGDERVVSEDYTWLFYRHLMLRPSCTVCPFASMERPSDITMGDCWGVEKALPGFADDNRGCSLLLTHTEAGVAFTESFPDVAERQAVDIAAVMQPNLQAPSRPDKFAKSFENKYLRKGLPAALRRFGRTGWQTRWQAFKYELKQKLT